MPLGSNRNNADSNIYYNDVKQSDNYIQTGLQSIAKLGAVGAAGFAILNSNMPGLRNFMHDFIYDYGTSKHLRKAVNAMQGIRSNLYNDEQSIVRNIQTIIKDDVISKAMNAPINDIDFKNDSIDLIYAIRRYGEIANDSIAQTNQLLYEKIAVDILDTFQIRKQQQRNLLSRAGWRQATVQDILDMQISGAKIPIEESAIDAIREFMSRSTANRPTNLSEIILDRNLLIDASGKLLNLKQPMEDMKVVAQSLITDFSIPMLNINPLAMLHLDRAFDPNSQDIVRVINPSQIQPGITGSNKFIGEVFNNQKLYYSMGNIYNEAGDTIAENMKLISNITGTATKTGARGSGSFIAKDYATMMGLFDAEFKPRYDTPVGRTMFNIMSAFGLGKQGTRYIYNEDSSIFRPNSWFTEGLKKLDSISPVEMVAPFGSLSDAYGRNTREMYIRKAFSFGEEGFFKQFIAGRNSREYITEATMVPYRVMARINGALDSVGLGLGIEDLGSTGSIYGNLMLKRILPVVVGIGAIKYLNSLVKGISDDNMNPEVEAQQARAWANVNIAGIKESLGITNFLKRMKQLMPGYEFIEEIPLLGAPFRTRTRDEEQEYWEKGYNPIRKGRFWSMGNSEYGGTRIERFRPNALNLAKSDYQFTDSMYGSADEYYANYWLPTPTHPFAPIRHFITDPNHYANKHYKDRPYPVTSGGYQELKELPIIGGMLNKTIGQILNPARKMHMEYWDGDRLRTTEEVESNKPINPYLRYITGSAQIQQGAPGMYPFTPISGTGQRVSTPAETYNSMVHISPSGQLQIKARPSTVSLSDISSQLRSKPLERIQQLEPYRQAGISYGVPTDTKYDKAIKSGGYLSEIYETGNELTDMMGFYGFMGEAFLPGIKDIKRPNEIQSSSDMLAYQRMFWDKDLGGLGGEISEIGRRFMPKRPYAVEQYNPIRNSMPQWLPGQDYFINFQVGDAYNKVREGEYRLPGEGYEALHGLDDPMKMRIGASAIGGTQEDVIKTLLHVSELEMAQNPDIQDILTSGTMVHKVVEDRLKLQGVSAENEGYVRDDELGISGYFDSMLIDPASRTGYAISDIKTISDIGFERIKHQRELDLTSLDKNMRQLQFYMYKTGQDKAYLHYVRREALMDAQGMIDANNIENLDPNKDIHTIEFRYNPKIMQDTINNVEQARQTIRDGIESGAISRGDLYEPFERFRILGDVAPYSDEFRYYRAYMQEFGDLYAKGNEEKLAEYRRINEQVSAIKDVHRTNDYRFLTANLEHEQVTFRGFSDRGALLVDEYDNPIKIAGIKYSIAKDKPEAMDFLHSQLSVGDKITIGYTADELNKVNNDTYKSISATIRTRQYDNLADIMIGRGIAEENEDDFSPAGVNARFTDTERTFGRIWERFAHLDTPFHTKFMQVRSPLEEYKRRDLYGKDFQSWNTPIQSFLVPMADKLSSIGTFNATAVGALVGSLFGSPSSRYGKLVGASVGALLGFALGAKTDIQELATGSAWIPKRRQQERDINEYIDMLNYVKNKRLYGIYSDLALEEEGFDVEGFIRDKEAQAEQRKRDTALLKDLKRDVNAGLISETDAMNILEPRNLFEQFRDFMGWNNAPSIDLMATINQRIKDAAEFEEVQDIGPYAAQAIMYRKAYKGTLYGYEQGDPVQNLLSALPRRERRYFMPFVQAPEEERDEILSLVPRYMRRPLQSLWGMNVEDRPDLEEYFSTHALPNEDWAGWNPAVNMEDVKVKIVQHEALDIGEFDIWGDDIERANTLNIPTPNRTVAESPQEVRNKLYALLNEAGFDTIDIQVNQSNQEENNVNMNLAYDRRRELEQYIETYGVM